MVANYNVGMPIKNVVERRKWQLAWLKNRRDAWFADKKCVDCGSTERLEIDHVNPAEKVANSVWSWTKKKRDVELAKCEVRCYKCHKKRTAQQLREMFSRPITHGTVSAYLKRKCKCDICRAFYKKWRRDKYERIGK
jgi:5-methylcytosine-specific restriction endonuclease McrA